MTEPLFSVAILAGGLATRLHPLTLAHPKALLDIHGQPFLARQLSWLVTQGITHVVICAGHLGAQLVASVGNGHSFGLHVEWARDGTSALGTAGALAHAQPLLPESFFVLYGDVYLPRINCSELQHQFLVRQTSALMAICLSSSAQIVPNVHFDPVHQQIIAYDKWTPSPAMQHFDAGMSLMQSSTLDQIPSGTDLAYVYARLALLDRLAGMLVDSPILDIGSFTGLQATRDYFRGLSA